MPIILTAAQYTVPTKLEDMMVEYGVAWAIEGFRNEDFSLTQDARNIAKTLQPIMFKKLGRIIADNIQNLLFKAAEQVFDGEDEELAKIINILNSVTVTEPVLKKSKAYILDNYEDDLRNSDLSGALRFLESDLKWSIGVRYDEAKHSNTVSLYNALVTIHNLDIALEAAGLMGVNLSIPTNFYRAFFKDRVSFSPALAKSLGKKYPGVADICERFVQSR